MVSTQPYIHKLDGGFRFVRNTTRVKTILFTHRDVLFMISQFHEQIGNPLPPSMLENLEKIKNMFKSKVYEDNKGIFYDKTT